MIRDQIKGYLELTWRWREDKQTGTDMSTQHHPCSWAILSQDRLNQIKYSHKIPFRKWQSMENWEIATENENFTLLLIHSNISYANIFPVILTGANPNSSFIV